MFKKPLSVIDASSKAIFIILKHGLLDINVCKKFDERSFTFGPPIEISNPYSYLQFFKADKN